jgi:hypothetical protein
MPQASRVFNGTFTISNPKTGGHKTYRVRTERWACKACWAGKRSYAGACKHCSVCEGRGEPKRTLSVLTGPDNTSNYKGIAFIDESGVRIWNRYRGQSFEKMAKVYWQVITKQMNLPIVESRSCIRCNRKLTTPQSVAAGIGPECAGKV